MKGIVFIVIMISSFPILRSLYLIVKTDKVTICRNHRASSPFIILSYILAV